MTNYSEFNKILRRLDGRHFKCKTFYDFYWNQLKIGKYEVYLKEDVDGIIKQLKEAYSNQQDEVVRQKKRANDLELENYQRKISRRKKKDDNKAD